MNRFFAPPANGEAVLTKEDAHHLLRVLRAKTGDSVEIAWEGRAWRGRISSSDPCTVTLEEELPSVESPVSIVLVQALAKGDKMDWIVQKAVELGVTGVIPVRTRYADVKLNKERAEKKWQHWQNIAEAAAKQSKRAQIPTISEVCTLEEAAALQKDTKMILLHEKSETPFAIEAVPAVTLFVGPEGGFSDEEAGFLKVQGAQVMQLGPRILRTETAGMAAISILQYEMGDLS